MRDNPGFDGNSNWVGRKGLIYAYGAQGIEELCDEFLNEEYEEFLDDLQRQQDGLEDDERYEEWLAQLHADEDELLGRAG